LELAFEERREEKKFEGGEEEQVKIFFARPLLLKSILLITSKPDLTLRKSLNQRQTQEVLL